MRLRLPALLIAVLALGAAGCDSSDDGRRLDADFYVGDWTLVGISDGNGDQTTLVRVALDDLDIGFTSAGAFQIDADFSDRTNSLGQADITTTGTYQAQADIPALILRAQGLAATLQAASNGDDRVRLTAPAVIVNQLLQGLPFEFEGSTTISIERQ